jgi:hypothetical protein
MALSDQTTMTNSKRTRTKSIEADKQTKEQASRQLICDQELE